MARGQPLRPVRRRQPFVGMPPAPSPAAPIPRPALVVRPASRPNRGAVVQTPVRRPNPVGAPGPARGTRVWLSTPFTYRRGVAFFVGRSRAAGVGPQNGGTWIEPARGNVWVEPARANT